MECTRGFGRAEKAVLYALLLFIAFSLRPGASPVDREDLPPRVRIARKIGDGWRSIKTAVFWVVVGKIFSGDEDDKSQAFQGPIQDDWIDCELLNDGYQTSTLGDTEELFGAEFPSPLIIPRTEWHEWIKRNQAAGFSLINYNDTLNFQAPEHSCVSNATETAIRVVRNRQLGMAHTVKLSPMSLYCRMNSRRWGGSSVYGNLQEASARGILPEDTPKQKELFGSHVAHQNNPYFYARELPVGWEQTAKYFRPLKFYRITSREEFASALLRGWPVVNGRDGHSICHLELTIYNGRVLSKYADSYGTGRGDGGYLYDSESKWATSGAWCLVSVTHPDNPLFPAGKSTRNQSDVKSKGLLSSRLRFGDAWDNRRLRGVDFYSLAA